MERSAENIMSIIVAATVVGAGPPLAGTANDQCPSTNDQTQAARDRYWSLDIGHLNFDIRHFN
jgi:hypothetical protein